MTDAGKEFDFKEIASLDEQIDVLLTCKPLPESQIKILCDKVSALVKRCGVVTYDGGKNERVRKVGDTLTLLLLPID